MSVKHTYWKLAALLSASLCAVETAAAQTPAAQPTETKPKAGKHERAEQLKLKPPTPTPPPAAVPDAAAPVAVASNRQPKPAAKGPQPTAAAPQINKAPSQPSAAGKLDNTGKTDAKAPQPPAADVKPVCSLAEAEQPRGGRLEVLGDNFGTSPVVRIAGKPARMIERRPERISVQIPATSDGGAITLLREGKFVDCGTLVIIGKNR